MNIVTISDLLIPKTYMQAGINNIKNATISYLEWPHNSIESLQKDNLQVEQYGPSGISLSNELLENIKDADVIVTQFCPVSRETIEKAPHLKLICVLRGGTENVDVAYAQKKGIDVINLKGRNARAVAEFTVGLMLSETRNISRGHMALKNGQWRKDFLNKDNIREINTQQIGLVGYGKVAQLVKQMLEDFGCKDFLIYDPYINKDIINGRLVSLDYLMENSDIISIHARATKETENLISKDMIKKMKKSAYFINTARSSIVDEKYLFDTLLEKNIAGAAIDTFDDEPLVENHILTQLDNVTITPHMAGSTLDAFMNSPKQMKAAIEEWLKVH